MTRRRAIKAAITLVLTIISIATLIAVEGGSLFPAPTPPGYYRVTEVFDGDTFAVDMNGTPEKIRLIGVDTPETHKPGAPVQCFGPEASDYMRRLVTGKAVRLEMDTVGDNRDRYDRLLRYAYLEDGVLINQTLITQGYGFAYLTFPFSKRLDFAESHNNAQAATRGLWAVCAPKNNNGRWQSNDLN